MKVSKPDRGLALVVLAVAALAFFAVRAIGLLDPAEMRKLAVSIGAATSAEAQDMSLPEIYAATVRRVWSIAGQVVAALLTWRALGPLIGGTLGIASGVGIVGYAALAVGVLHATGNLDVLTNLARQGLTRGPTGDVPAGCSDGSMTGGVCLGLEY